MKKFLNVLENIIIDILVIISVIVISIITIPLFPLMWIYDKITNLIFKSKEVKTNVNKTK